MAALALVALAVSVSGGVVMDRRGWSRDLRCRLRLLAAVTAAQLALTISAPVLRTPAGFTLWVLACAATIGIGIPVTFSLMADLIPVRDRGFAAAVPAALSFFVASLYPQQWRVEEFSAVMAAAMGPAVVVLTVLATRPSRLVDQLGVSRHGRGRGRRPKRSMPKGGRPRLLLRGGPGRHLRLALRLRLSPAVRMTVDEFVASSVSGGTLTTAEIGMTGVVGCISAWRPTSTVRTR